MTQSEKAVIQSVVLEYMVGTTFVNSNIVALIHKLREDLKSKYALEDLPSLKDLSSYYSRFGAGLWGAVSRWCVAASTQENADFRLA